MVQSSRRGKVGLGVDLRHARCRPSAAAATSTVTPHTAMATYVTRAADRVASLGVGDAGTRVGGGNPVGIVAVGRSGVGGRVGNSVSVGNGDVGDMDGVASSVGNIMAVGGSGVGGGDIGGRDAGATVGVGIPVGNIVAVGVYVRRLRW